MLSPAVANAAPDPTTGVELNHPIEASVGVAAAFDFADGEDGFRALKELRANMWDKNPPFQGPRGGTTLRESAATFGYHSKDAYVNAIRYDHGHSKIAVQRSVEAAKLWDHARPYNSQCTLTGYDWDGKHMCAAEKSATVNGIGGMQNLAKTTAKKESLRSVVLDQWGGREEYNHLLRANGRFNDGNGHLWQFLNPENTYWGLGIVVTNSGTTSAASMGRQPTGITSYETGRQVQYIYRAADGNERPTGLRTDTPRDPVGAFGGSSGSSGDTPTDLWNTIAIIMTVLSVLSAIAGFVRQIPGVQLPF